MLLALLAADAKTAGAEWDETDVRSIPVYRVDIDMPLSWERRCSCPKCARRGRGEVASGRGDRNSARR